MDALFKEVNDEKISIVLMRNTVFSGLGDSG